MNSIQIFHQRAKKNPKLQSAYNEEKKKYQIAYENHMFDKPCKFLKESIKISHMIEKNFLDIAFRRWRSLRKKMLKDKYLSRKLCEHHYGVKSRVEEIKNIEDLASLLLYYSDRWHPSRVLTFDESFKKILYKEKMV
jgi:hypothetical protein